MLITQMDVTGSLLTAIVQYWIFNGTCSFPYLFIFTFKLLPLSNAQLKLILKNTSK